MKSATVALRDLRSLGLQAVRVRHYGDSARIEAAVIELPRLVDGEVRKQIVATLKELGFIYVTLDLEGFHSGSMNEALRKRDEET